MAYRPRGRGGGQRFVPRNDRLPFHCAQLGLSFPPDPHQVHAFVQRLKCDAEHFLNSGNINESLQLYTSALTACELFPRLPPIVDEHHKLLCNRSLVFLKMRMYKEAERDALDAIQLRPDFLKGYWRASQAVKGGYNGTQLALLHLVRGLKFALEGEGTIHDIVTFLTEICVLLPKIHKNDPVVRDIMEEFVLPEAEDVEIWSRVIKQLATQNNWESLAMLCLGYNEGPSCGLDMLNTKSWNWSALGLGSLFAAVSEHKLKKWGEKLAVELIGRGCDVDQIGKQNGCPTMHYAVKLALHRGFTEFLKAVLVAYRNVPIKLNAQDKDSRTALHILVLSGRGNLDIGRRVLDLLLQYNCEAGIPDSSDKRPVDYAKPSDAYYETLRIASKSVEELRKDIEVLKAQGNASLKAGNHAEALERYSEALKISEKSRHLYKEAAVLYSNRANVFFSQDNYTEALTNAIAAVSCDSAWHKGHWWKGKTLLRMGSSHDAFGAYMDGYIKSEVGGEVKFNFLFEAVLLLKHIPGEHFMTCYNQLRFLNRDIWPGVLSILSRNVEWKCIAYLILGTNLDRTRFSKKVDVENIESLCTGVAGSCETSDVQLNTAFQYMKEKEFELKRDRRWLDATVLAAFLHGEPQTQKTLPVDEEDCLLHAAVRFALQTGRTSLLENFTSKERNSPHMAENQRGDTVFHSVTKFRPLPGEKILGKVVEILLAKGLSVNVRDANGRLPVEYLDNSFPGHVFDLFFKASKCHSIDDINKLKELGNTKFKNGEILGAIDHYDKAIEIFKDSREQTGNPKLTNHEVAVLYGNRAEGYLKLQRFGEAFDDAKESVCYDGHWYKGHMRVGKALKGIGEMDHAKKAFINAYNNIDGHVEDKMKVDILLELANICSQIPWFGPKQKIDGLPGGLGHLWARACYELVKTDDWAAAAVAYQQYRDTRPVTPHLTWTLKPFCSLSKLNEHWWGVEMIQYFLECGCSRKTISLEEGDTYLHAVVKISLQLRTLHLLNYLTRIYCRPSRDTDQHRLDSHNNTVLHTATLERKVDQNLRFDVIVLLLKCEVNPNQKNSSKHLAIDYLPGNETRSREALRMAMYNKENISKLTPSGKDSSQSKVQPSSMTKPFSEVVQSNQPMNSGTKPKRTCDLCQDLLTQGKILFKDGEPRDGYEKMVEMITLNHKGGQHEKMCQKAIAEIVKKLAETHNPEIPKCLTTIPREMFLMIIDSLSSSNKWRQVDMLVRKYRLKHGSDQLKGFASNLSVVPVVRETSLKGAEDVKLQIVVNLLNSGASLGSDCGETALKSAIGEDHFKVLTELVNSGADTTKLSMYKGDTPIHAAMVIVLEKDKRPVLLEYMLDQFKANPEQNMHLDPEQLDGNGDCLFHLLARAKYSTHVVRLTEMLCRRNLSANYYNKDGKLPLNYITKKNDRRLQYLRLARSVAPSREQVHSPKVPPKEESTTLLEEDLHQMTRPADNETQVHSVIEVMKTVSVRDQRKRNIEELIRHLPDSKHSIFKPEHSASKKPLLEAVKKNIDTIIEEAETIKEKLDPDEGQHEMDHATVDQKNELDAGGDWASRKTPELKSEQVVSGPDVQTDKVDFEFGIPSLKKVSEKGAAGQSLDDSVNTVYEDAVETLSDLDSNVHTDSAENRMVGNAGIQFEERQEIITDDGVEVRVEERRENAEENDVQREDREMDDEEAFEESDEEAEEVEEEEDDFELDVQIFDNLEWEVECTAEVWKTLRDKHVTPELKRRIVRKIQLLASGDWQPHLCKKLKHAPPSINLYEAKFSKGSRIIWELAIAFSPRCSETAERRLQASSGEITQPVRGGRIYSEIIRVWEIVLDHGKIFRCVQRIKKSHQRGETCIIQKKLRGMKDTPQVFQATGKRYPMLYAEEDISEAELQQHHEEMTRYFPPASANDTEYHILKFYSFSSTLVSHVLQNIDTKVDFPFRVTDLEHAIINLKSKAPILLLGRSGTGKTTCCLYRLWSQYHSYWCKAKEADAPLLPRCVEFVHQEVEDIDSEEEAENSQEEDGNSETDEGEEEAQGATCCSSEELSEENVAGDTYDHLHQLFITKNAVLSNEVQKNFRELSHADDTMREHVQHEEEVLPNRLQDIQDYHFPLFLTSRQLLLMLDASLGPPYFFERKEDGSLKVDIAGWTDMDGPLSFLPLLDEDSDDEEGLEQYMEEDQEGEEDGHRQATAGKKLKVDPRREITYSVFVEEIWPRTKKKMGGYHPSLIWMEIMSFIKGSYEALSKPSGYLKKEEYFKLGRKRAPNFSGERDTIYTFFIRYEHFKKQHSLFDETDLVHDAFLRLRNLGSRPWVLHQIFVDETQDFTQAELCLLIRLCQNPNDMFLTGDTAQSIMRGISFRFSDLRSLFYHAKQSMQAMGKTSAVEVPKQVYQLTHNYRSHAGILSLATSVLELMVEFFPESFDRLQPDQGLFHGPQPILLESCSFGDLAVLLRGNRRKTSHIEFGAHQAILVVNDAARESIPEELRLGLILTIYEAKGLEFDDVLLYNFFKDSQALKEWRVVTDFLERLAAKQKEEQSQNCESLVNIDHAVLSAAGRPRPLNFDPNQHKVLNSELKHLYTALTRARVNVWIFDEDPEKRAPMFEYFKARKLVKCLQVEEINETSLSETMFAEKSSASDWIRRGEDFMRHSLYTVAAKCFGMGGDHDREKVALAHGQALKASRLQDNPREMREEFLLAAELYMECKRPAKAALCLQNAKERELAAQLFEKLGQYEKAAEMYRRLKRPTSSSECYEQLGNFNKAIEVLYENDNFDQAIDTLKRYHMLVKDFQQKRRPLPQQLIEHEPKAYTEEKLSHRAAEMFHRYKNTDRMLASIDRFPNINDKVDFLKRKNYIPEAATILEEDGQLEAAANLLLMYGRLEAANLMARKTLKEEVIAQTLLVTCRAFLSKKHLAEEQRDFLNEGLREAFELFQACNDADGAGQICLLQALFSGEVERVKMGWKAFISSRPFPNGAGLVECCEMLVKKGDLSDFLVLQSAVRGLEHMFSVCQVLLDPHSQTNREKVLKYDRLYGLEPHTHDKVIIHPKQKPVCLSMLSNMLKNKAERKKQVVEVTKTEAHEEILLYLLNRGKTWLDAIQEALDKMRNATRVCEYFHAGLECPDSGNVDRPCTLLHAAPVKEQFQKLINVDLLMIEFEATLLEEAASLSKKCPPRVKSALEYFLLTEQADSSIKYRACLFLWNDLMPLAGHPLLIGNDSKDLLQYIKTQHKVLPHVKRFLLEKWKIFTAGEKKLKSAAARETEMYLMFEFAYHLFGFDEGKRKLESSPTDEMTKLERMFDEEIHLQPGKAQNKKYYTLMIDRHRGTRLVVTCIARRFYDAYALMSKSSPDPFEAVFKFSKFSIQLGLRDHFEYNFYPDLKHYLFWLEFYTCVAIVLIAKLKSKNFPDFVFVLPSNYFALIQFIEATFPSSGLRVFDSIGWWSPGQHKQQSFERQIMDRLKGFCFVVSGHAQGVKILDRIVHLCKIDPTNYALLERLLILNMTMVCNVGKAVAAEAENSLMSCMCHLATPSSTSDRLQHVLESLKSSEGIADVATLLGYLLEKRGVGEEIFVCKWVLGKKQTIFKTALQNVNLFSQTFLNEKTQTSMQSKTVYKEQVSVEETPVDAELDEEELETGLRHKEEQERKEELLKAVLTIQRWFRAKRTKLKVGKQEEQKPEEEKKEDYVFDEVTVDDKMCGICGVFFQDILNQKLELEKSTSQSLVGGHAAQKPTSEERKRNLWGTAPESKLDTPELKKTLLKKIIEDHKNEARHVQKAMEQNSFMLQYKTYIAPKLDEVKKFLNDPDLHLTDPDYVAKYYAREQMSINRMFNKCNKVEKEIQLVLSTRRWSTTGAFAEQSVRELEGEFQTVKPLLEEIYMKLKQDVEENGNQVQASSSVLPTQGENWDDDLQDLEHVVDEPAPRHRKTFYNRYYRGHRKQHY